MEEFEYDVVIYGTGLVNCLVASILTKNKFKVLHIDKNSEYGTNYRTLTFKQLLELKNLVQLNDFSTNPNSPSPPTESDTAVNRAISNSSLSSLNTSSNTNFTSRTSTLNTGTQNSVNDGISIDSSNGSQTLSSLDSISSMNSNLQSLREDITLDEGLTVRSDGSQLVSNSLLLQPDHQIYYKVDPFGDNQEGVLKRLMNQSNSFNIDLWPRILLNNTKFTDFLVYTNIHKQLQLCTNINTNVLFTYASYLKATDSSYNDKDENGKSGGDEGEGLESNVTSDKNGSGKSESEGSSSVNKERKESVHEELKDDLSTSSTNDGIEPDDTTSGTKDHQDKATSNSSTTAWLFELVHDKNSIFRCNYLDLKEKRLLTRFISRSIHGSVDSTDINNRVASDNKVNENTSVPEKATDAKLEKKDEKKPRRRLKRKDKNVSDVVASSTDGDNETSVISERLAESKKVQRAVEEGEEEDEVDENWVEYLKRNNLNDKLIKIVNCMRLSLINATSKNKCELELNNYLRSFKVGSDKTATENRNCIIYCLYGTNNLIQHLCRLSSLNNCHYMLNHEIKDMEVVNRSCYSRVNSILSTNSNISSSKGNDKGELGGSGSEGNSSNSDNGGGVGESGTKETSSNVDDDSNAKNTGKNGTKDVNDNNKTATSDKNDVIDTASKKATLNSSESRVSVDESLPDDMADIDNTKILLHLNEYNVYTRYVITEYPVPTTATINRVSITSTSDGSDTITGMNSVNSSEGADGSNIDNGGGEGNSNSDNGSEDTSSSHTNSKIGNSDDANHKSGSSSETKLLVVCVISDQMVLDDINMCMVIPGAGPEGSSSSADNGSSDKNGSGKSALEGSGGGITDDENWTVIFQTCKDSQSSPEGVYVVYFMSLVTASSVDDLRIKRKGGDTSEESEKLDSNVLRMVNMYKALVGNTKHMLFISYTYFNADYNIEVIAYKAGATGVGTNSARAGDNGTGRSDNSNASLTGTGNQDQVPSVNQLTVYNNKYKNDSLLVFMNELKVSQKVAELVLKLNDQSLIEGIESDKDETGKGRIKSTSKGELEEVEFEQYLKCIVPDDEDQVDINCEFFMDFINKFI